MSSVHALDAVLNILSLICNALILAFMIKSLVSFYLRGGRGNMRVKGKGAFMYFTVQSNVLMALTAAMMLVFNIITAAQPAFEAPHWMMLVKHMGTVAVMLTFSVVFFIFVPSSGVAPMIEGDNLFLHLISPLIAALTLIVFDRGVKLSFICVLTGLIPTALYAALYYYMVMVKGPERGGWEDFYRFNAKGKWLLMAVMIFAMTALIGLVLCLGHNLIGAGLLA